MNTPAQLNLLFTELRQEKDLNFFTMRLINPDSDGKEGTLDYALNLFLLKVVTEAKEYWALEGSSLEAFKDLAQNWEDLVSFGYLRTEKDYALVITEKIYTAFLKAINHFYPDHTKIAIV